MLVDRGLPVSDAIQMLLVRIAAEKAMPFEVKAPNAVTARMFRLSDRDEAITRCTDAADTMRRLDL